MPGSKTPPKQRSDRSCCGGCGDILVHPSSLRSTSCRSKGRHRARQGYIMCSSLEKYISPGCTQSCPCGVTCDGVGDICAGICSTLCSVPCCCCCGCPNCAGDGDGGGGGSDGGGSGCLAVTCTKCSTVVQRSSSVRDKCHAPRCKWWRSLCTKTES